MFAIFSLLLHPHTSLPSPQENTVTSASTTTPPPHSPSTPPLGHTRVHPPPPPPSPPPHFPVSVCPSFPPPICDCPVLLYLGSYPPRYSFLRTPANPPAPLCPPTPPPPTPPPTPFPPSATFKPAETCSPFFFILLLLPLLLFHFIDCCRLPPRSVRLPNKQKKTFSFKENTGVFFRARLHCIYPYSYFSPRRTRYFPVPPPPFPFY